MTLGLAGLGQCRFHIHSIFHIRARGAAGMLCRIKLFMGKIMPSTWTRIALLVSAALFVSGCAVTPLKKLNVDGLNQVLDDYTCVDSNGAEIPGCRQKYQGNAGAPMRLLRGHLVITVFARYGAARFDSYSDDLANDATRLMGRIEAAEATLYKAWRVAKDTGLKGALYEVNRVDAFLALLQVVNSATAPTRRGLLGLVAVTTPLELIDGGVDFLRNALRDKLYLDAYRQALAEIVNRVGNDRSRIPEAWAAIDEHLDQACATLAQFAGIPPRCMPNDPELPSPATGK